MKDMTSRELLDMLRGARLREKNLARDEGVAWLGEYFEHLDAASALNDDALLPVTDDEQDVDL